jgi:hypothetical protein
MNLGNMLAAGKSFISGGASAAYRENKRVYLPKFNADKNPFAPKATEPVASVAVAPGKNSAIAAALAVAKANVSAQKISSPSAFEPAPVRATNWANKLNPFRAAPVAAAAPMPTVQPELLSLEDVKVIHNDLTDADVEVVPAKSRNVTLPEVPMLPPAREPWEFMGERLVKSV